MRVQSKNNIGDIENKIPYFKIEEVVFELTQEQLQEAYDNRDVDDSSLYLETDNSYIIDETANYVLEYNGYYIDCGYVNFEEIDFYNINDEENQISGGIFYKGYNKNWEKDETKAVIQINRFSKNTPSTIISGMRLVKTSSFKLNEFDIDKNVVFRNSISMGRKRNSEIGSYSVALGRNTIASGSSSHAEGSDTTASGWYSHAEGSDTTASGSNSHAEGSDTTASGSSSHAEGNGTIASGSYSHAEGYNTTASGWYSHTEGSNTIASGWLSHAEGNSTIASGTTQHVQGKFNIKDTENKYLHIVGNGTGENKRSNAHTLDWEGNGWFSGKLSQEGTPTDDKDLVTKGYVDANSGGSKLIEIPIRRNTYQQDSKSIHLDIGLSDDEDNTSVGYMVDLFFKGGYLHFIISTNTETKDVKVPFSINTNLYTSTYEGNRYSVSSSTIISYTNYVFGADEYFKSDLIDNQEFYLLHLINDSNCFEIHSNKAQQEQEGIKWNTLTMFITLRDIATQTLIDSQNKITIDAVYFEECNFPTPR